MTHVKTLALSFALAFIFIPFNASQAEAQMKSCGFCLQNGPGVECEAGTEQSQLLCEGVFLGFLCLGCEIAVMELPDAVRPDGSLDIGPGESLSPELLRVFGDVIAPGIYATRIDCNNGLSQVWLAEEAEQEIRATLSSISI
jgi:hypothetical protein